MEKTIEIPEGYEEYKRKALEPIVNYIESVMASYSKEELEALIKKALQQKESEDERIRKELIDFVNHYRHNTDLTTEQAKWCKMAIAYLEKQKEQKPESCDCSRDEESYTNGIHHVLMNPEAYGLIKQKPAEWSEEDEKTFELLHTCVCRCINDDRFDYAEREQISRRLIPFIERLSSLRPQPKAELTLLDENIIKAAVAFVEQNDHFNCWGGIDKHTVIKALRSLKPHWKPSEEQMKALESVSNYLTEHTYTPGNPLLISLYNDLKKL